VASLMFALTLLVGITALVLGLLVGGINLYQAVTGKRVSKKPSRRSDAVMRRQSAIAAAVMIIACGLLTVMMGSLLAGV
jgi:hypothetical protein